MKKGLKLFGAAAILLMATTALRAQGPRGDREKATPEQRIDQMTERMTEQLSLSDEQASKIKQILTDQFESRSKKDSSAFNKNDSQQNKSKDADRFKKEGRPGGDRADMRKTDSLIRSVLTEEQNEKWNELREQNRPSHGQRPARQDAENSK